MIALQGWRQDWKKIIRTVIFKDYELRRLMKLPSKTGVIQFADRYFIRAGFTNKLLTDEVCRIVYADIPGKDTENPNVRRNMMMFDVYVKNEEQRNVSDDGLDTRSEMIVERLYKLLTQQRYLAGTGFRFWIAWGPEDLGTRTPGYSRTTFALYYMKVY